MGRLISHVPNHVTTCLFPLAAALLCAGAMLLSPGAALAQSAQPNDAAETGDSTNNDERARELYLEGDAHYAAGRYEEAARSFTEAYELSKRSQLLFNLGNTYERMGDYEQAAAYLQEYIDQPRARDVVSIRQRIRRLNEAAERERRRVQDQAANPTAQQVPADGTGVAEEKASSGRSSGPYYWLITGGVLVGGAVGLGLLASQAGSDAGDNCAPGTGGGQVCLDAAESDLNRETSLSIGADVALVAGVAVAGVGLYLLLTDDGGEERRTALVPSVSPHSAGIGLHTRF